MLRFISVLVGLLFFGILHAQDIQKLKAEVNQRVLEIDQEVVAWRRHFHQYPELSNREFKTGAKIAQEMKKLGYEVQTGIGKTGVVATLKGKFPGPVIGLRADIDGLPVVERVNVPFKSVEKGEYLGQEVGVMHACGHDTHIAMLLGAAKILKGLQNELRGTVKFIFQPAEEGAPPGESGGAKLMIDEGVLKNPDVEAIFGLHINSMTEVGKIRYKAGGELAAADVFNIKVKGKQAHGSTPWFGVDPIVVSAQIILGLQTIVSRQSELTNEAAVITVGKISGGVRNNIIPEEVNMTGTIRTLDKKMQALIHENIRRTAVNIAESAGALAEVEIEIGVPVTINDPILTAKMLPSIFEAAGEDNVLVTKAVTGAEDFAFYANEIPGLFLFVGGMPKGTHPLDAAPHHTPDFYIDDSGLSLGVKTLCYLVLDYARKPAAPKAGQ